MTLAVGSKLGPYEILGPLGAGGMGEVYRARDKKLKRDVALKVLPDLLARDPERVARFQHEAEVLAALNHPNIAMVYGWEESTGTLALVMELVGGAPLSERIRSHRMDLPNALTLATQIASGLEAAHKAGVIHRDLKPANVMVTPAGVVKLIDFGLAKLLDTIRPARDETETINSVAKTEDGRILGTVAYMSPEQAQANPVDARSDIFSFGIVLFEMFTGTTPFQGKNNISTLAAILQQEARRPSELTDPPLPLEIDRIVLRCLRKDPERRFQTVFDLRLALEDVKEDATMGRLGMIASAQPAAKRWPWVVAAGAIVAMIVGGAFWLQTRPETPRVMRQVTFEAGIAQNPALSPDGKLLAYASDRSGEGPLDIWLKQIAGGEPVRLTFGPGTKNLPQFSVDGAKVYYLSGGDLFEVPTLGGPFRKVLERVGSSYAVSSRGEIVTFHPATGDAPGPITILPSGGGTPEVWRPECQSIALPAWSPEGERLAFEGDCGEKPLIGKVKVFVAPRRGGSLQQIGNWEGRTSGSRLAWFRLRNGSEGVVLPLHSGDSINLFRIGLNGRREAVTQGTGAEIMPAISAAGELVFTRAEETPAIWSVPLQNLAETPTREAAPARSFAASPDGRKLVFGRMLGSVRGEVILRDRVAGTETVLAMHDVVTEGAGSFWPQVSPDGSQVVYRAYTDTWGQYLVSAESGAPRLLATVLKFRLASDWSPDGKRIIGECAPLTEGICELDPASGTVRKLLKDPQGGELLYPSFSWDGKWVAFMRRRSGKTAICATPVRADGTLAGEADWVPISPETEQASRPRFSPEGSSMYYEVVRRPTIELVKQKLDPAGKRPVGGPLKVASLPFSGPGEFMIGVTRDRLFFNTDEIRSNIWMTRLE